MGPLRWAGRGETDSDMSSELPAPNTGTIFGRVGRTDPEHGQQHPSIKAHRQITLLLPASAAFGGLRPKRPCADGA